MGHLIRPANRISLCMIVRDEAKSLERCLTSVSGLVDEMIIVDTGSEDGSQDVARRFGATTYDFVWTDDFAAARNFALSKAGGDWILVLDADEFLDESQAHLLRELTDRSETPDVYLLPIKNLMSREYEEWQHSLVLRLFKNLPDLRFQGRIHEQIIVPARRTAHCSEEGPTLIHLGYLSHLRPAKSRRNFSLLQRVLAEDGGNPYTHFYLSTEYLRMQNYAKAWDHVGTALDGIPADVVLFRTAAVRNAVLCLTELDRLDDAESLLKAEIQKQGGFPDYHHFLGNVYRQKKAWRQAIACYNRALELADAPLAGRCNAGSCGYKSLFFRGLCQQKQGRYWEAAESFRMALHDHPPFDRPLAPLVQCLLLLEGAAGCLNYLTAHFEIVSPELGLLISQLFLVHGYPEAALDYLKSFADQLPAGPVSFLRGEAYLALHKPAEAEAGFRGVSPEDSLYGSALINLRLLAWQQGQPAAAEAGAGPASGGTAPALVSLMAGIDDPQRPGSLGPDLLLRLGQLGMDRHAQTLVDLILQPDREARWSLSFQLRKAGFLTLANRLQNQAAVPGGPQDCLESAKTYLRLASHFQERVPILPHTPRPGE